METIAATLPVDSMRGVAYSTFTIIRLIRNQTAELIQYDNPQVIVLRNGENWEYPRTETTRRVHRHERRLPPRRHRDRL